MAENSIKLFGFEITRAKDKKSLASPVPPRDDDGAGYVTATSAGAHYGHYINMDGDDSKDNAQLILKYRGSAMHPEADAAIELGDRAPHDAPQHDHHQRCDREPA